MVKGETGTSMLDVRTAVDRGVSVYLFISTVLLQVPFNEDICSCACIMQPFLSINIQVCYEKLI